MASSEPSSGSTANPLPSDSVTLDDLLGDLARETPDVKVSRDGNYRRDDVVFASRAAPNAIELRLGAEIADAANRTPHTGPSPRGEDWVRLETPNWKDVRDRLGAWYRVAWRLAAKERR